MTGATGPAGLTGPQGLTGPMGLTGPTGLTGPQGSSGNAGGTGQTGATGPQGVQGLQGPGGSPGNPGATGATGPSGPLAPIGSIILWSSEDVPSGWLQCDGTAVSRATYADLFAVVGVAFGSGDGSTTFNLPDLCHRVPIGFDPAYVQDGNYPFDVVGENNVGATWQITTGLPAGTTQVDQNLDGSSVYVASNNHQHTGAFFPPYLTIMYIIRYS